MEKINFEYYYGKEAEQFTFFRIPKTLFTDHTFKSLSVDAKVLYGILLDRMSLSMKNNWLDEENRVYIIYPIEEIAETFGCGTQKATKILQELDDKKGIGLVEKKRLGLGKPNILYVKNFIVNRLENEEKNQSSEITNQDLLKSQFKNSENHNSGMMNITKQELLKSPSNKTNINKTDNSDTDFNKTTSISPLDNTRNKESIKKEMVEELKEKIKGNISYGKLIDLHAREKIDLLVDFMVEAIERKEPIKIKGLYIEYDKVKERLLKLEYKHLAYALDYLNTHSQKKVSNLKAYLLAILYNAEENLKLKGLIESQGEDEAENIAYDQDTKIWNDFLNNS